jgi:hypothetical protein
MVEIHEPMRLLLVVESDPARLRAVVRADEALDRLVGNRWIQLATLDPGSQEVRAFDPRSASFLPHAPEAAGLPRARTSLDWYRGRRDPLPPARVGPG